MATTDMDLRALDEEIARLRGWTCMNGIWYAHGGSLSERDHGILTLGEGTISIDTNPPMYALGREHPRYSLLWALAGPLFVELLDGVGAEKLSFYGKDNTRGLHFLLSFEGERDVAGEMFTECIARAWRAWKCSQ